MELQIEEYDVTLKVKDLSKKGKEYVIKAQQPNPKSDETTITSMKARVKNKTSGRMNNADVTEEEAEELQSFIGQLLHGEEEEGDEDE